MHEMGEKRYRFHHYRTDDRTYKQTCGIRRKWQGVLIARCTRHVHVGVRCQVVRIEPQSSVPSYIHVPSLQPDRG